MTKRPAIKIQLIFTENEYYNTQIPRASLSSYTSKVKE